MINVYAKNAGGVWFAVAFQGEEIFATNFGTDGKIVLDGLLRSIPFDVPFQKIETATRFAERAIALLKDLFDGKGASENLSFAMQHLSGYTQKVLKITSLIPLGYVASYGSVASVAGGSPRAVGRVMALNPFAPVIPCHRVVGSDLSLVGYGGGLKMKLELLKRERRGYDSEREIAVDHERLRVFPVEFVLKKVSKR
ncbi:MAG TPA: methylated-DNA--[protein]-cysteine S-methyltransferase [Candidatus Acidoferrum sp.]|nr:methylated-DNA--[protein]-cysteine S-methyltransferase [Candidatus Acidoferrum sp.]